MCVNDFSKKFAETKQKFFAIETICVFYTLNHKTSHMKCKFLLSTMLFSVAFTTVSFAQNVFSGERVQVVGSFNGYGTTPYGTDYRTTTYRTLSTTATNPNDGRGQWATTINVAATGGDVVPINMAGGGGNGFLFISGPTSSAFQNKWVFNGVGQAAINGVNSTVYNGSTDMGLDMSTPGFYTFVMNDFGYSASDNTKFFVARTDAAPVNVTRTSEVVNVDGTITVNIVTSAVPSTGEQVYVRYVYGIASDFSGATPTDGVRATGSGTAYTAIIPAPLTSTTVKYYVFTSTATNLGSASEIDRSLSVIRYDDNAKANYITPIVLPIGLKYFNGVSNSESISLKWKTSTEQNANSFDIEKLTNNWTKIGTVSAANVSGTSYEFTDNAVANGSNTYRLKLVDKDGKSSYSAAITINAQVTSGLKVYPTLVNTNSINVVFNEQKAGKATIKVTALNGKVLQQNTVNVNAGNMVLQQTLPLLTRGNYLVTINTAQAKKTFTILVQ